MKKDLKQIIKDFPHIGEATEAVLDRLKDTRKTCLIMPTGTGKTIVSGKVIKSLGKKSLYLCPSSYILDQTKNNLGGITEYMTYPELMVKVRNGDLNYFKGIDLFVLDEFHRLGSEVWGKKSWGTIEKEFPEAQVLGITATEIRYLDGGRDMSQELFGGDIAYELTYSKCFRRNILRAPKYVIGGELGSWLDGDEVKIEDIQSASHKKKVSQMIKTLRGNWEKAGGIPGIFKKYIIDNLDVNLHRMIVFHERIAETPKVKRDLEIILRRAGYTGEIKFYVANSGESDSLDAIKAFNTSPQEGINILLAVNMCNEGLHIEGCEVAVMFRKTLSKNIYLQQIGRVISLGGKNQPVILDLVQNFSTTDGVILRTSKGKSPKKGGLDQIGTYLNLPEGFEIVDTLIDYQELFEALDEEKQNLKEKLNEWYNLALQGNLDAFGI